MADVATCRHCAKPIERQPGQFWKHRWNSQERCRPAPATRRRPPRTAGGAGMTDRCQYCRRPLAWFAKAGVWVHEETTIRRCDPDRAPCTTAAPSELHVVRPTLDTVRPVSGPSGGSPSSMSEGRVDGDPVTEEPRDGRRP